MSLLAGTREVPDSYKEEIVERAYRQSYETILKLREEGANCGYIDLLTYMEPGETETAVMLVLSQRGITPDGVI